ncbi:hypothetical protein BJY01DRAFT_260684 [Aspergillus pseudoustus]|uniref:Zn(2)-C6 fungal-type domain-containing protein n=1 Tax=Aspergillus pseudoustus TaxID=1810923 RepID=A0ABR4IT90_9EURO
MVYRGKPSPGCALCRTRRVKCDRRQPSCSQCLRVKRQCSGYQDLHALRFFDQTEAVATKAQARAAQKREAEAEAAAAAADRTVAVALQLPIAHVPTSIHEQAMSHSLRCYVGTDQGRGILSYLPELLKTDPSDALLSTLRAIGLSSISRLHNLPGLKRSAGEEYCLALRATNRDLQHASTAVSDSTLATVVLLGLYEIIECHESDILHGWYNHVQGSIKLLELRGKKQLESPAGLELFRIVRLQITMSNLFYRTKYYDSPGIASLSKLAAAIPGSDSQAMESLYAILIPLNELSIAINDAYKRDGFSGNTAPLIAQALRLDAELASWAISLDPSWHYTTVTTDGNTNSTKDIPLTPLDPEYHLYPHLVVAALWNHYRHARIVLHEMLRPMCASKSPSTTIPETHHLLLAQSRTITTQMLKEICASAPYFFTSDEKRYAAVVRLPWALFVAADCTEASEGTKGWIADVLERLAASTGVQQARLMAGMIRGGGHGMRLIPGKEKNVVI